MKTSHTAPIAIKVYDILGRLVDERSTRVNELETTTIGDGFPSGVYTIIVTQNDETRTVRVVKR